VEKEIELFEDGGKFQRKKNVCHHNGSQAFDIFPIPLISHPLPLRDSLIR
jgi:hypothetical protein